MSGDRVWVAKGMPPRVCKVEVLPEVVFYLTRWPSPWARFWFKVFFGWRVESV